MEELSRFPQANIVIMANNEVIKEFDAHQITTLNHALSEVQVSLRRLRIPRGMVVGDDEAGSRILDGFLEDFAGMGYTGIDRANKDDLLTNDLILAV